MKQNINNFIYENLSYKICPIHLHDMEETTPFISADKVYRRDRFKCPKCECRVDFVGDELKEDSFGRTLEYIDRWLVEYEGHKLPVLDDNERGA